MQVSETELSGVLLIEPKVFGDERGYFLETWAGPRYRQHGVPVDFVQDNLSKSRRGTLRGLHLQHPHGQAKLVYVVTGEVFDVAVDVRVGSPTFGRWYGTLLSETNKRQLFIPAGFAHGFCVSSEEAIFAYKCSEGYHPETELTIAYDDPDLAIPWPISAPTLSKKDTGGTRLAAMDRARLPRFAG
ncbi:MAG TPA: dTDP-4-dehydrorhamnose 3,5-epimerase [Polyangiaceae bacterium]|nr:dTDP-4-dehydrorhamnose 3,5-epimerase [Polyangiaceae bacterium]